MNGHVGWITLVKQKKKVKKRRRENYVTQDGTNRVPLSRDVSFIALREKEKGFIKVWFDSHEIIVPWNDNLVILIKDP